MNRILCVFFCLISIKCHSQIEILLSPRIQKIVNPSYGFRTDTLYTGKIKELGIYVWPYQKVNLKMYVNSPGNRVLIEDTTGKVLYTQAEAIGNYEFNTTSDKEVLVIYDRVNDKNYAVAFTGRGDNFHALIGFGNADVKINVTATSLPRKQDTANQHFVRFLKLGHVLIDEVHFSVSLSKIPPFDVRTEPEINIDNGEDNVVTDTGTYNNVKKYIYANKGNLQQDTIGLNYNSRIGSYKIIIDNKYKYYLKWDKARLFLRGLFAYMYEEKGDKKVINDMKKFLF